MLDFPPWKVWAILLPVLAGLIFALPNLLSEQQAADLPDWLPKKQLNLGLDLRGGSHLLLEADPDDVRQNRLEALDEIIRTEMRQARSGQIRITDISTRDDAVSFRVRDGSDLDRAVETMRGVSQPVGQLSAERDLDVSVMDGDRIVVRPTDSGLNAELDRAMAQAVEVVRRRIDEMGTREPTIIREGRNRIVVQVPGLQDPNEVKSLLGKTAKLEFHMVDTAADPEAAAAGRAPPGSRVVPNVEGGVLVVKRRALLTGDQLVDSQQTFQDGMPVVSFRFDSVGAKRFARATQENTGKPFAIILDGQVISAPRINEPILGGSGIISGNFTTESANELAILLRSGKLPVALEVVEQRVVGPDLGADSIRAGSIASVLAIIFVAVFMILVYGRFGVYSVLALLANGIMILGVMSVLGATLTLAGIAGFVLTVGTAVDANVLINEYIREELRKGKTVLAAVEDGYTEASRTIYDANATNAIAAIIMYWLGSGPLKGFGIVLTIGIASSVFTAVFVSRLMVVHWLRRARPQKLVI